MLEEAIAAAGFRIDGAMVVQGGAEVPPAYPAVNAFALVVAVWRKADRITGQFLVNREPGTGDCHLVFDLDRRELLYPTSTTI